ncbi:MAG TPA: barnase inhibitor, partial [Ramlibacter sp.]|nr:barnase inhibitor [Ramlibacter sp.]
MENPLRRETTENALKGVRTNIVQSIRAFRVQDLQDAARS